MLSILILGICRVLRKHGEDGAINSGEINKDIKICKCGIFGNWALWFLCSFVPGAWVGRCVSEDSFESNGNFNTKWLKQIMEFINSHNWKVQGYSLLSSCWNQGLRSGLDFLSFWTPPPLWVPSIVRLAFHIGRKEGSTYILKHLLQATPVTKGELLSPKT